MHILWRAVNYFKLRPELLFLLLVGFSIRIIGSNPGYFAHGDEIMYGEAVYMFLNKTLGMETQFLGYYPPLVAWVMLIFFVVIFIPLNIISGLLINFPVSDFSTFFNQFVLGKNWINAMYWGRYITVFFGTGVILLTYILTERVFRKRLTPFLSAFFVTINYRLVLNSQIGFLDMYNSFFLLVVFLAVYNLLQKPHLRNYIFAWISVALLFLIKYQVYGIAPLLIVHCLICFKQSHQSFPKMISSLFRKEFMLGGVIALFIVLASHYYHYQNFQKITGIYEYQSLKYGVGKNMLNIFPVSYWYHVGLGPFLSIFALSGGVLGLLNKKYSIYSVILFSPLVLIGFTYLYYTQGGFYTRNFIAAVPVLLIFAAFFLSSLLQKVLYGKKLIYRFIGAIFVISLLSFSLQDHVKNIFIVNQIQAGESNRTVVQRWIDENIPKKGVFGSYSGNPAPSDQSRVKFLPDIKEVYSYEELKDEGIEYALLDFHVTNSALVWWMNQPTDIGISFWKKPDDILSHGYIALATRELLWRKTLKAYLPGWQIPGYSYAVIKITEHEISDLKPVEKYTFDQNSEGWEPLYFFPNLKDFLKYQEESLVILPELTDGQKPKKRYFWPGTLRWQSPKIKADGLHGYKIIARIKNLNIVEKDKRDGFLRVDFYGDESRTQITSRPIISFVSERVYGDGGWHEVEVEGVAPENIKFLAVGFQADNPKTEIYLDWVEIFETYEKTKDSGVHYTIHDDDFFPPNDGGFL